MRILFYIFLSLLLSSSSCLSQKDTSPAPEKEQKNLNKYQFPFDLSHADESQKLPKKLTEISGLTIAESGALYAVQDENGSVFKIHGEDIDEIPFRKDGDYEGIEIVGEYVYVIKSSGTVYRISNLGTDDQIREDFNDFLSDEHDVEGLCYHKESNSLLLACKGTGLEEKDAKTGTRAIYQFDLESNKILEQPLFEISIDEIKVKIKEYAQEESEAFQQLMEDKGNKLTFAPSAIAIHPITQNYYITSSKGKLLAVFNRKMELLHIEKLDKSIHQQPEGLTFDKDGNLYVSNEGKDKEGIIYKFNYNKQ